MVSKIVDISLTVGSNVVYEMCSKTSKIHRPNFEIFVALQQKGKTVVLLHDITAAAVAVVVAVTFTATAFDIIVVVVVVVFVVPVVINYQNDIYEQ